MYAVWKGELINGSGLRFSPRPRPYAARLTALDSRWGFKREFIKPYHDYSVARKSGKRGIYAYFILAPHHIYECYRAVSWGRDEKFYYFVNDEGEMIEWTKEQVIEWLKNNTSE